MTLDKTRSITHQQLEALWPNIEQTLHNLGITCYAAIGSTWKNDTVGDIDIAVGQPSDRSVLFKRLLDTFGATCVRRHGSGVISFAFPIDTEHSFVQVDLMVGSVEYLSWARCGTSTSKDHADYSMLKGVVRNILLTVLSERASVATFANQCGALERTRYVIDFDRGLFIVKQTRKRVRSGPPLKEWKTLTSKLVSAVPDEILRVIIGNNCDSRNTRTFEGLARTLRGSCTHQELVDIAELLAKKLGDHKRDIGCSIECAIALTRSFLLNE